MQRIYLDYAATAPLRAVARDVMLPWFEGAHNASSLHYEGRKTRGALDAARDVFARAMGVKAREVYFTASGSESISLALLGSMRAFGHAGRIITSPIEHRAVLAAVAELCELGWQHITLDVDACGAIHLLQLEEVLGAAQADCPQIVSCMLVNNELGTINDVAAAARIAKSHHAVMHCDAIGAGALVPFAPMLPDVDLLSLAAHKFGGPLGTGILVARASAAFTPIVFGGGQEFGKRAGTENLAAIIGAAAALREVEATRAAEAVRVAALRDRFEMMVCSELSLCSIHASGALRAPGVSNVAIHDLETDVLPVALDLAGVSASAGSACASGALQRSHVVEAIGYRTGAVMRFSWGNESTESETLDAARRFVDVVGVARTGRSSVLP